MRTALDRVSRRLDVEHLAELTPERLAVALLRRWSVREVARVLRVPKSTVFDWQRRAEAGDDGPG